ncbi:MAG: hypothetical protein HOO98_03935 [Nitrospira sp.]|jgi:hypothetical protein|nr:hypothetical protein [Nitrospira sp.]
MTTAFPPRAKSLIAASMILAVAIYAVMEIRHPAKYGWLPSIDSSTLAGWHFIRLS